MTITYPDTVQSIAIIPAATEWGYAPYEVLRQTALSPETVTTQNAYSVYPQGEWTLGSGAVSGRIGNAACDWKNSLDGLQAKLKNAARASLYVSWYGMDLRAADCQVLPGVASQNLDSGTGGPLVEFPHAWGCAGYTRYTAHLISTSGAGAAYGGTPDDQSVIAAIADLTARGIAVTFVPFLLMDIPAGNTLPDPIGGGMGQAAYPWRGRITKRYATADESPAIDTEVAAFASRYSTFILHYATLCATAGGVDTFLLGTELCGLTFLRDGFASHPFVNFLVTLAGEVAAILPDAKISYAADWTEFTPFQGPGGDLTFHLDPLWTCAAIAGIGIDVYWPLSDWRDTAPNADGALYSSIYDPAYLAANIQGGEGYDWFYASGSDRTNQIRTRIADFYGEPWVFRFKDIGNWWSNQHFNRSGGVPLTTPTAWVPQSKPIWFTEIGIPSIDKGTNEPNVFSDPKSSESAVPYFSTGRPDYRIQIAGLQALHDYFDPTPAANPVSTAYGGNMVDLSRASVYYWDARPFPWFPALSTVWGDAGNYVFGQSVAGKLQPERPIARQTDSISHGGSITSGAAHTNCNGLPVARSGDAVNCAIHGAQTIGSGSSISLNEGSGVARLGDAISCGATITSGSPNSNAG